MSQDALGAQSKYKILKNINSGSYGQVQLAVDRTTGEQVAIKLMERGSKITKYVERELINHSHLLHPHIVQVSPRGPRGDRASGRPPLHHRSMHITAPCAGPTSSASRNLAHPQTPSPLDLGVDRARSVAVCVHGCVQYSSITPQ